MAQIAVGVRVRLERSGAPDLHEYLLVAPKRQGGGRLAPVFPGGKRLAPVARTAVETVRMAALAQTEPARVGAATPSAIRSIRLTGEERRGTRHESEDHRLRDVAGQIPEAEDRDQDLDRPDHRAEQEHRFRGLATGVGIEVAEGGESSR